MKIDPNLIIGTVSGKTSVSGQTGQAGVFEDILSGVQKTDAQETASVQSIPQINQISPYKVNALTKNEEALEMLDGYAQALLDPQATLKSLAPMVDELDAMKTELLDASSFLSDDDPLKGIMGDTASTLYGEVLRFRRGDLTG